MNDMYMTLANQLGSRLQVSKLITPYVVLCGVISNTYCNCNGEQFVKYILNYDFLTDVENYRLPKYNVLQN